MLCLQMSQPMSCHRCHPCPQLRCPFPQQEEAQETTAVSLGRCWAAGQRPGGTQGPVTPPSHGTDTSSLSRESLGHSGMCHLEHPCEQRKTGISAGSSGRVVESPRLEKTPKIVNLGPSSPTATKAQPQVPLLPGSEHPEWPQAVPGGG